MLLGVVEENRKEEVMENLGVCAQLVEKIRRQLTGLEGKASLQIIFVNKQVIVQLGTSFDLTRCRSGQTKQCFSITCVLQLV